MQRERSDMHAVSLMLDPLVSESIMSLRFPFWQPLNLMRYLMRYDTSGTGRVLDLTMHTGVTGSAALLEGRSFIGVEKDTSIFKEARRKLFQLDLQLSTEGAAAEEEEEEEEASFSENV